MPRTIHKPPATFVVEDADAVVQKEFWDWYESPEWEPDTVVAFTKMLTPDTKYVDLGGFLGPTALFAANLVARVQVVEPNPLTRQRLRENVALNPDLAKKIQVYGFAVAAKDGTLRLRARHGGLDSESSIVRTGDAKDGWDVEVVAVDRFLNMDGAGDADFFKIDVEGAEFEIIPAMADFIRARRPTIYLATHASYLLDKSSFWAKVKSGFRVLGLNWRMMKVLMAYKYHYRYDPAARTYRDVKWVNRLRLLFPVPTYAYFFNTGTLFTDRPFPAG